MSVVDLWYYLTKQYTAKKQRYGRIGMKTEVFQTANTVISALTDLAKNRNLVFRGYSKQAELLPKIIREKNLSNREIELLVDFEKYGLQYFSVNNAIDFMSYAQHFGLPTRLLDFTYNPFIALFFALFKRKGTTNANAEDNEYYYIRYCDINEQIVFNSLPAIMSIAEEFVKADSFAFQCKKGIETIDEIIKSISEEYSDEKTRQILMYFSIIYRTTHKHEITTDPLLFRPFINDLLSKFENERILIIDANQCSSRIIMQQGLFMFPYSLDQEKHKEILTRNTNLIKIHKDARNELLEYLDTIGLNSFRLMPDLQNVCDAIKRKYTEERKGSSKSKKEFVLNT